ncbi:MAG: DUF4097 family beta strand repeat-containing protein [Dictyoglomus sp.]|nr:DUF4097 family beta strand repeat-containing protein [Dictyoglomus sp.]MCX7941482.1 DUF4097 family beta strand repeat-containing protein [Dictyoglomaceae bacterium]MDW8187975.1 DUF4097 family beta strand repeat-containing protein [Dictyoglomus sp.]
MEEVRRILKMLEEGKITAEEAEKLISAIEEKGRKERGILNFGKIIGDTVSSALSVIPEILGSVLFFSEKEILDEKKTLPFNKEEPLEINISGGDLSVKIGETDEVILKGKGRYNFSENKLVLSAGDFFLSLPKLKELKLIINAGDFNGEIYADKINIILNAGDADIFLKSFEVNCIVNMGDMDIKFMENPKRALLNCSMGDLSVVLPDNFDGVLTSKVSLGDFSILKEGYRYKDKKYIFGTGEKGEIEIYCKMGDVKVK